MKSGMVTAKELSQYCAQRGGARRSQSAPKRQEASRSLAMPDITCGIPSRPPTPITDVLHQYARRWVEEQLIREQARNVQKEQRVPAALDTFRDPEAREQAFRAHQSNSASRRGVQGLGTYSLN